MQQTGRASYCIKRNWVIFSLRAITISGQSPISNYGINIEVSPNDKNGNGNGQTGFIRYYYDGASVNFTAPTFILQTNPL